MNFFSEKPLATKYSKVVTNSRKVRNSFYSYSFIEFFARVESGNGIMNNKPQKLHIISPKYEG